MRLLLLKYRVEQMQRMVESSPGFSQPLALVPPGVRLRGEEMSLLCREQAVTNAVACSLRLPPETAKTKPCANLHQRLAIPSSLQFSSRLPTQIKALIIRCTLSTHCLCFCLLCLFKNRRAPPDCLTRFHVYNIYICVYVCVCVSQLFKTPHL